MVVLHKWPAFLKKQKAKKRIAITATAIPKNIEQMKGYFLEKLWCCTSGEVTHLNIAQVDKDHDHDHEEIKKLIFQELALCPREKWDRVCL